MNIFEKKFLFEMLTVQATELIFDTRREVLVKQSTFSRQKYVSTWGGMGRTPNIRIYSSCSHHLGYQGQAFAVPYFGILALAVNICLNNVYFTKYFDVTNLNPRSFFMDAHIKNNYELALITCSGEYDSWIHVM